MMSPRHHTRMRMGAAVLGLTGCNQVFDIGQTDPAPVIDAQYFDAPLDAPYACPPVGTAPMFARQLQQIPQRCGEYTASAATGRAIVTCEEPGVGIHEGPLEGPFTPAAGLEEIDGLARNYPRLAPEGNEVFISERPLMSVIGAINAYRPSGDVGSPWVAAYSVNVSRELGSSYNFSAPTRGPTRRMMLTVYDGSVYEIEFDDAGNGREVGAYTGGDLGGTYITDAPTVTPDGLRIVYRISTLQGELMGYADRPNLDVRFGNPKLLDDVPSVYGPFLTEDCARLYFTGLGYVLWLTLR